MAKNIILDEYGFICLLFYDVTYGFNIDYVAVQLWYYEEQLSE